MTYSTTTNRNINTVTATNLTLTLTIVIECIAIRVVHTSIGSRTKRNNATIRPKRTLHYHTTLHVPTLILTSCKSLLGRGQFFPSPRRSAFQMEADLLHNLRLSDRSMFLVRPEEKEVISCCDTTGGWSELTSQRRRSPVSFERVAKQ